MTESPPHRTRVRAFALRLTLLRSTLLRSTLIAWSCAAAPAWAQDDSADPYYIGVSTAYTQDSNLFKASDGAARVRDSYTSTGLLAGVDQPFGRQRFFANGNVRENRFNDTKRLNNTSYGLNVGLDWSTIERISGAVSYARNESLVDYASLNLLQEVVTAKNIQDTEQFSASVRYGITARVGLVGGYQKRDVRLSAPEFADRQYDQNVANLGVTYGASGLLTLGTGVRRTETDFANNETTSRNDLDFTATWVPSGLSTVTGRISATSETGGQGGRRDFSGTTGSLGWAYRPTGKLAFVTSLARDTGTELTFLDFTPTGEPVNADFNRVVTRGLVGVNYEATAKIRLNASASQSRSRRLNNAGDGNSETSNRYALGVSYQPMRTVTLGCNANRETRSAVSGAFGGYDAEVIGCSAELRLQL